MFGSLVQFCKHGTIYRAWQSCRNRVGMQFNQIIFCTVFNFISHVVNFRAEDIEVGEIFANIPERIELWGVRTVIL